jgi:anhydro-N-acetylmuramic acid kinase
MNSRWIIGLASGSSADGVDAVLLEMEGAGLDVRMRPTQALHRPYPRDLRDLILRVAAQGPADVRHVSLLHRLLGETFAAAVRQVADQASLSLQHVQCIGCPGHTVWHETDGRFPSTLDLGMAAVVAERTGVTVVSDFRARDLTVGGQGGPLNALVDHLLFLHPQENRALLHLGGTATVVYLPASARALHVLGFEAGPCSLLLDGLMRQVTSGRETFDPGGKHAVQGRCIEPLLERWLAHPYLQRRPPKSLPRQAFGEEFIGQAVQMARKMQWPLHDLLCTATHFVARGITGSLQRFLPTGRLPDRILLSGGAVRNGLLWHLLEQQLADVPLDRTDRFGVPAETHRAMTFGVLAALTVDGVAANLPAATGAAGTRLLGSLTPGSSANWARCVAWIAAQAGMDSARN